MPPFFLFRLSAAYYRLKEMGATPWDHENSYLVVHRRVGVIRSVSLILLLMLLSVNWEGVHEIASRRTGEEYTQRGEYEKAAEAIRRAGEINSKKPDYPRELVEIYRNLGRFPESLEEARRLKELTPDLPQNHETMAKALFWNGQIDEAIAAYREAPHRDGGLVDAHAEMAFMRLLNGQAEAALAESERYFKAVPDPYVYHVIRHSMILQSLGRTEDAKPFLKGFDARFKNERWAGNLLRYQQNVLSEGELIAKAHSPGERCEAYFYTGWRALLQGNNAKAGDSFRKAVAARVYTYWEHPAALFLLSRPGNTREQDGLAP